MNQIYWNYLSEYEETIIVQPNIFIENKNDNNYLINNLIIDYGKNKFYTICTQSVVNPEYIGKYSQVDYIYGNFCYNDSTFQYFAFYFSSFDKNNLSEVCVDTEKDLKKYSFCIKIKICKKMDNKYYINVINKIKEFLLKKK